MVRILIDLQGAQTESRFRGIGRYSLALSLAIARQGDGHEVHILLNGSFPTTLDPLRAAFRDVVTPDRIHVFEIVGPTREIQSENAWRAEASRLLRDGFIAALDPDVVFCPSLVEGFIDDAVTGIGPLYEGPTVATLHDLIPLIFKEDYLAGDRAYSAFYMEKIADFKEAAGLLAISQSSMIEARDLLGFAEDLIVNASEGADQQFRKLHLPKAEAAAILAKFGIEAPFVLYTGGADHRKNLERLLAGFAALSPAVRSRHQLVLAGRISSGDVRKLKAIAERLRIQSRLVITGYVTDDDLVALYNLATAFVFPSLHEGFGLPVLEAMKCGVPTIGSNASSIPEVLGFEDALFDPTSTSQLAARLEQALTDELFRQRLLAHAQQHCIRFTWERSAERALEALVRFARSSTPAPENWADRRDRLMAIEDRVVSAIASIPLVPDEQDMLGAAQAIANNFVAVERFFRPRGLPSPAHWRLEGPFDSSYSLALVNRELARALSAENEIVSLWSSEGPGDFKPQASFLAANADIRSMHDRAHQVDSDAAIVSRNMYPPRVSDMSAGVNGLHCYAWEETGFPAGWIDAFNENLQFATVTSGHVKKVLRDAGAAFPMEVVGNGVDHWTSVKSDPDYRIAVSGFKFLHVSSCFPRKGVDVLLQAYGEAFTSDDDITLIIKTFPNPHNEVEAWLETVRQRWPSYPKVVVIYDEFSDCRMKSLYEQCDVLVAPSRAEGFGLPLAEAALSGAAVITTGWSGQLDFCVPPHVDLIDFRLAPADSHLNLSDSLWAEPDVAHLAKLLQKAFAEPKAIRAARARKLKDDLLARFTWSKVAKRQISAARQFVSQPCFETPRIGWVSTYNQRCGIATYSEHLLQALNLPVTILAPRIAAAGKDPENVIRCWVEGNSDDLSNLEQAIVREQFDTVVIQFNYGFYNFSSLSALIHRLAGRGVQVMVTLHATTDPSHDKSKRLKDLQPALRRCARLFVHSVHDMNRLKDLQLLENVTLLPHGVVSAEASARQKPRSRAGRLIATYGFFLPNKGIPELVQAIHLLRQRGMDYRLRLVNAEYPAPVSRGLIASTRELVRRLDLQAAVEFHTGFFPDQKSLELISSADLMVYNYQDTGESASGAVRYGIASGVPVAVTPLPIFDDVAKAVFRLPGLSIEDIARGICGICDQIGSNDEGYRRTMEQAECWRNDHSYSLIGRRLSGLLTGLHRDRFYSARQDQEPAPGRLANASEDL